VSQKIFLKTYRYSLSKDELTSDETNDRIATLCNTVNELNDENVAKNEIRIEDVITKSLLE